MRERCVFVPRSWSCREFRFGVCNQQGEQIAARVLYDNGEFIRTQGPTKESHYVVPGDAFKSTVVCSDSLVPGNRVSMYFSSKEEREAYVTNQIARLKERAQAKFGKAE